jgi:hypothetical protein
LNQAGIGVEPTAGAGKLVERLKDRGWRRVEVGQHKPGDVGVTFDRNPPKGADHVYLLIANTDDANRVSIADNQWPQDEPHERPLKGAGKTSTEFFLRA